MSLTSMNTGQKHLSYARISASADTVIFYDAITEMLASTLLSEASFFGHVSNHGADNE